MLTIESETATATLNKVVKQANHLFDGVFDNLIEADSAGGNYCLNHGGVVSPDLQQSWLKSERDIDRFLKSLYTDVDVILTELGRDNGVGSMFGVGNYSVDFRHVVGKTGPGISDTFLWLNIRSPLGWLHVNMEGIPVLDAVVGSQRTPSFRDIPRIHLKNSTSSGTGNTSWNNPGERVISIRVDRREGFGEVIAERAGLIPCGINGTLRKIDEDNIEKIII